MTIASTVSRNTYVGTGSAGPFAYTFRVTDATDLQVTTRDLVGLETTLSFPSDYSVTGVGLSTGGTITLTTPLTTGWALAIRRVPPLLQNTSLRNQGVYAPATVEDALDTRVMQLQDMSDALARSVHVGETIDPTTLNLALPVPAASKALVWNVAGTGFDNGTLSSAQLSAWSAANNQKLDTFVSGTNFTAGTTTQLTLSSAPGNVSNLIITRRTSGANVTYLSDEYSVSGSTVTFSVAIPTGTTRVEARYFATYQVNTVDSANATWSQSGTGVLSRSVRDKLRDTLSVLDFSGVDNTGVTDSTTGINAAITQGIASGRKVVVPGGTYAISSGGIVLADGCDFEMDPSATFVYTGTGRCFRAVCCVERKIILGRLERSALDWHSTDTTSVGASFQDCTSCKIEVHSSVYFFAGVEMYGDDTLSTPQFAGCVSNTVHLGWIYRNKKALLFTKVNAGYVNSNHFIIGTLAIDAADQNSGVPYAGTRYLDLAQTGNGNTFTGPFNIENNFVELNVECAGAYNLFVNPRLEAITEFRFTAASFFNTLLAGYLGLGGTPGFDGALVTDLSVPRQNVIIGGTGARFASYHSADPALSIPGLIIGAITTNDGEAIRGERTDASRAFYLTPGGVLNGYVAGHTTHIGFSLDLTTGDMSFGDGTADPAVFLAQISATMMELRKSLRLGVAGKIVRTASAIGAGVTTPDVATLGEWMFSQNTGSTIVTNLLNGTSGQTVYFQAADSHTTLKNNTTISLIGGADRLLLSGETVQLLLDGTTWREIGKRS